MVAHALRTPILYQKSGLLTEISRRDFSAAGLSGLSLPDAPCEHTTIRATAANLTRSGKFSTTPCQFAENRASKQWKTGPTYFPLFGRRHTTPCPHGRTPYRGISVAGQPAINLSTFFHISTRSACSSRLRLLVSIAEFTTIIANES